MSAFDDDYSRLECDFKAMAKRDGDVFIPMIRPAGTVDFVLVGSEPAFARWAKSPDEAERKVQLGYRNSATTVEDFVFHHSIKVLLCEQGQSYYVTDLSKGAMLVKQARQSRFRRYDRWFELFQRELLLLSHPGTTIFAVGAQVSRYLNGKVAYAAQLPHFGGEGGSQLEAGHARAPEPLFGIRTNDSHRSCDRNGAVGNDECWNAPIR